MSKIVTAATLAGYCVVTV